MTPSSLIDKTEAAYSGTVTEDSSLKIFLNGEYLNIPNSNASYLGTDRQYIETHAFYVSTPGDSSYIETIDVDSQQEKQYAWNGKIGLIQVTDYMKTSTNTTSCTSLSAAYNGSCGTGNYLKPSSEYYWTISPHVTSSRSNVLYVSSSGYLGLNYANDSGGVRPAFYITSNINLKGEGTSTEPYYID